MEVSIESKVPSAQKTIYGFRAFPRLRRPCGTGSRCSASAYILARSFRSEKMQIFLRETNMVNQNFGSLNSVTAEISVRKGAIVRMTAIQPRSHSV